MLRGFKLFEKLGIFFLLIGFFIVNRWLVVLVKLFMVEFLVFYWINILFLLFFVFIYIYGNNIE